MKPRKYPYSGKLKLVRKELPRFIMLRNIAFDSGLIEYIDTMQQVSFNETIINFKIPKSLSHEVMQMRVQLPLLKVVEALNRY